MEIDLSCFFLKRSEIQGIYKGFTKLQENMCDFQELTLSVRDDIIVSVDMCKKLPSGYLT